METTLAASCLRDTPIATTCLHDTPFATIYPHNTPFAAFIPYATSAQISTWGWGPGPPGGKKGCEEAKRGLNSNSNSNSNQINT